MAYPWYGQVKDGKPWGQGCYDFKGHTVCETMWDGMIHGFEIYSGPKFYSQSEFRRNYLSGLKTSQEPNGDITNILLYDSMVEWGEGVNDNPEKQFWRPIFDLEALWEGTNKVRTTL